MKMLSSGQPSTLKTYLGYAYIFGQKSVDFIEKKIKESPNGENEEVLADETQMFLLFVNLENGKEG